MRGKPPTKRPAASAIPDETLTETVLVRLTPTEKRFYGDLARKDLRSLSAWVRIACAEKARAAGAKI